MGTFDSEVYLELLITRQRKAIQSYILFAIGLVVLGVIIIVAAFLFSKDWLNNFPVAADDVKGAFGWGGVFITSLLGVPIKEIVNHRGKIHIFKSLKQQVEDLKSVSAAKRAKSQKRLDDLIWSCIQKAAMD